MNTVFLSAPKDASACCVLTEFLVVFTLLVAGSQPVMAIDTSQPTLPSFCNVSAQRAFPEMPGSLKCTPAPEPYIIDDSGNKVSITPAIIKNKDAAIALGKMLFWDSQVGSDGMACASCHFQAGADNRIKNQVNPGLRNASGELASDGVPIGDVFDLMATFLNIDPLLTVPGGKGPNYTLKKDDFPFRKYREPANACRRPTSSSRPKCGNHLRQ